jgi:hypothetical protein
MARPVTPIQLTTEQSEILNDISRRRELPHSTVQRAQIVLAAATGQGNKAIGKDLNLYPETAALWRNRWLTEQQELDKVAGKSKLLLKAICSVLADSSRPGSPCTFTAEQVCQIISVACETPPAPLTHWTRNDLVRVVIARGIVETISASTIGRILKEGDLKPHRSRYWLNHTVEDEAHFRQEVRTICKLYHQAEALHAQGVHVVSTDEKTGIQALEPIHPTQPMIAGRPEQKEFEYERHGTQTLIANFEVATGRVISPTVGDTRTEEDFANHIRATIATAPNERWIFIADQLNTHKSETLVKVVAELCGIKEELGVKGESGILHNMTSRADFLQDKSHRIRFVYTPKHCSWLNQVEMWFGMLSRRLLKRGRFSSTDELKKRILEFIEFFNKTLAKPFRWTYIGKPLMA